MITELQSNIAERTASEMGWQMKLKFCVYVRSNSDDNLLKNIELFDKLSLRFNGRILFIKDVIGSQEICCWSYYGHGQKIAEVCCTSIVYGTDKKHTKVTSCCLTQHWSTGNNFLLITFFQLKLVYCEKFNKADIQI